MRSSRLLPALVLLLFSPARADDRAAAKAPPSTDATKAPAAAETAARPSPAGAPSMVVTKDPVTGQLRAPTAEEMRALNALRPQAVPVAPQVVVLPNGTKMVRLGEENMSYAVVRRNPDGTLRQSCVEGGAAAAAAIAQTQPAPSSPPRKEER